MTACRISQSSLFYLTFLFKIRNTSNLHFLSINTYLCVFKYVYLHPKINIDY